MKHFYLILALFGLCGPLSAASLQDKSIIVDGIERTYVVHMPETGEKPPVVFVFHGHGGNIRNTSRTFAIHKLWPEACVVYMQGLKTPGRLTDPQGKRTGWQHAPGDQGDRDLKFFDAVLASLQEEIDTGNVFSTGHSNGGGFTYLLLYARGDNFRAMAPSSAAASSFLRDMVRKGQARPVIHYAARNDPLVKYSWQMATLVRLHAVNHCEKQPKPWHSDGNIEGKIYPSSTGTPIVTLISDGDHKFPPAAAALFVRFFKQQMMKTSEETHFNQENTSNTNDIKP